MKSKILFLAILLLASTAYAQESKGKMIGLGMNPQMADYIARKLIHVNTSGDTEIRIASGKKGVLIFGSGTPGPSLGTGGIGGVVPAPVVTVSTTFPTPNSTDTISGYLHVIATAGPTLAHVELPIATSNAGQPHKVYNKSASPLLIVPKSGDTINALVAATPFSCATGKLCECEQTTTTNYACTAK